MPGESPLKYYDGWQHFWLIGVRRQVAGLNAALSRHSYVYAGVVLGLGVILAAAGLIYGPHVDLWEQWICGGHADPWQQWLAPVLLGAGGLLLLLGLGGLASAVVGGLAAGKDGGG
jgi:hypothetical protein